MAIHRVVAQESPAPQSSAAQRKWSRTRKNWWVNLGIFLIFVVSTAPHFTGMTIHEWLGLAFGAGVVVHLLLHWEWLATVVKRAFKPLPAATRINAALNVLLFVALVLVVFSGLLISETVVPALGQRLEAGPGWRMIHALSADAIILIAAAHIGLHWSWIASAFRTYVLAPLGRKPRPAPSPVEPSLEVQS